MSYMHYIKLMRDAAPMVDNLIHRLTDEGHAHALRRTKFEFGQTSISVTPAPEDRDVVFGLAVEQFSKAKWGYSSRTLSADEDPKRPTVEMTFNHPRTLTRLGEEPTKRPWAIGFDIPMPDPSVPITAELIDYYADRARDIARGLMAQQVVDEEGKMPGTPGQGGEQFRPPLRGGFPPNQQALFPVSPRYSAPQPLHTKGLESDESDD